MPMRRYLLEDLCPDSILVQILDIAIVEVAKTDPQDFESVLTEIIQNFGFLLAMDRVGRDYKVCKAIKVVRAALLRQSFYRLNSEY